MGDVARRLDRILPDDITNRGTWCGNELVLPYPEASRAISFASEHEIAILGLEAFEVQKDGLLSVDLADACAYIRFTGDWKTYVAAMNAEAERWINEHRLGENHGYILTSALRDEFATLNTNSLGKLR